MLIISVASKNTIEITFTFIVISCFGIIFKKNHDNLKNLPIKLSKHDLDLYTHV